MFFFLGGTSVILFAMDTGPESEELQQKHRKERKELQGKYLLRYEVMLTDNGNIQGSMCYD
jgi:hypothetical protein